MSRFSQKTAEAFLEPYAGHLTSCITRGFEEYIQRHGQDSHKYEIRTKSNIIRDNIVDLAKNAFREHEGVAFVKKNHYTLMNIGQRYLLRFKKLNPDLTSSNYATQQALDFCMQLEIPGIPPAPLRLDIGYVPDPLMSRILGIYVVCRKGKRPIWSIQLDETNLVGRANEIEFAEYTEKPKVRIKSNIKKGKEQINA